MDWLLQGLGWSWVVVGLWGLVRPAAAHRRLDRLFRRKSRWIALLVLTVGGGALCVEAVRAAGGWGVLLGAIGLVSLANGIAFLRRETVARLCDWWAARPVWVYRAVAAAMVAAGLGLQWWTRAG